MTPKEKAKELMLKYYDLIPMGTVSFAKQCALIAVNETLKAAFYINDEYDDDKIYDYYINVKIELEKL